ncbi:MAG TPA: hypothetical protein VFS83_13440 [Ktedonobacterales bacterium]|nr:hypothetical protein [Ktedonobacterales bacterium]
MRAPSLRISAVAAAFCVMIASVLLAGCGAASASTSASTSATATCPPAASFKTVTGKITAVGSGSIAVTDSQGKVAQVRIAATTRLTQIAHPAATSLAVGTSVLVLTDTNATVAQRINVLGAGANGSGGSGGFGFGSGSGSGRPTGTPSARANARCFQRTGQGFGQGTPRAGNGASGAFQGVQGTIDTINSARLTFHDAQGQEYSVAITPATVIQQTALAKTSDLTVGMNVAVVGSASSAGIAARTIAIQGQATGQ